LLAVTGNPPIQVPELISELANGTGRQLFQAPIDFRNLRIWVLP
jgi:hypothetical protein